MGALAEITNVKSARVVACANSCTSERVHRWLDEKSSAVGCDWHIQFIRTHRADVAWYATDMEGMSCKEEVASMRSTFIAGLSTKKSPFRLPSPLPRFIVLAQVGGHVILHYSSDPELVCCYAFEPANTMTSTELDSNLLEMAVQVNTYSGVDERSLVLFYSCPKGVSFKHRHFEARVVSRSFADSTGYVVEDHEHVLDRSDVNVHTAGCTQATQLCQVSKRAHRLLDEAFTCNMDTVQNPAGQKQIEYPTIGAYKTMQRKLSVTKDLFEKTRKDFVSDRDMISSAYEARLTSKQNELSAARAENLLLHEDISRLQRESVKVASTHSKLVRANTASAKREDGERIALRERVRECEMLMEASNLSTLQERKGHESAVATLVDLKTRVEHVESERRAKASAMDLRSLHLLEACDETNRMEAAFIRYSVTNSSISTPRPEITPHTAEISPLQPTTPRSTGASWVSYGNVRTSEAVTQTDLHQAEMPPTLPREEIAEYVRGLVYGQLQQMTHSQYVANMQPAMVMPQYNSYHPGLAEGQSYQHLNTNNGWTPPPYYHTHPFWTDRRQS